MKFQIGDIINAKGSMAYLDFCGYIEIINIIDFEDVNKYQADFFKWWFGEKERYYLECKERMKKLYVGIYIEDSIIADKGKIIVFSEEFLDMKKTIKINGKERRALIKIAHAKEADNLSLPKEVASVIRKIAEVLDSNYGTDRDVDEEDGGYVLVIEKKKDFKKLKQVYIDVDDLIPEYANKITCSNGKVWTNTLVLMNNDFGISILCSLEIAPRAILDEISEEE